VGETYHRALELSRRLADRNIFAILSGAWVFHIVRGDLEKAWQFSLDFLRAAELEPAAGLMLAGNFLLGSCLFHLGQLKESLKHMTSALGTHDRSAESVLALFAGPDLGVFCRSYLAHLAWHREDGNHAGTHAAGAIAAANRIRDPFSQAIALDYAALLHAFQGESRAGLERGREAVEVCSRHGFAYYLAMGNIVTGWATAAEGDIAQGLAQLREGLEALRALGAELRLVLFRVVGGNTRTCRQGGRGNGQPLDGVRIREQERRGMGGRRVVPGAGGTAGCRRKGRPGVREFSTGYRGCAAVGFARV
jgi:adenylate cyclase